MRRTLSDGLLQDATVSAIRELTSSRFDLISTALISDDIFLDVADFVPEKLLWIVAGRKAVTVELLVLLRLKLLLMKADRWMFELLENARSGDTMPK